MVKTVLYNHTNSYDTLNELTDTTKCIWICFHGLGYLSKYFKKYFINFPKDDHYFIIPQAPSKYYQGSDFKHVGASWLTRENTMQEMDNVLNYLDKVITQENIKGDPRIVLMGYSQGVSIATRFMSQYFYNVKALIIQSGSLPQELNENDGQHFETFCDRIIHISGTKDEYVNDKVIEREKERIDTLFGTKCEKHRPDIKHVVHVELLQTIAKSLT
ncbi:hypothetical protein JCM19294_193 [Nonlabens tegetincola]|uniref:Phospholipase/carboxylesterase/thioesterase domain-containing protein n=2 Tax=Nonlabens tegetincola TaxID=323273 RepID=A0A090Q619_9FLAO|nr:MULTISPECIES: esterase [Nonlabens]GAK97657.1 hypothetical protein JCM19294_193 [Nonlabens tegetincola]